MLVVVRLVHGVTMSTMQVVQVVDMGQGLVAAIGLVDVHMCAMQQVLVSRRLVTVG